jgi:glycosyltransferase involved in cell wall biosynthesis
MSVLKPTLLSVVVPLYNESAGFEVFHASLVAILKKSVEMPYEIIYCNDGSRDDTLAKITEVAKHHTAIRVVSLSRNFGKELATTAGIHEARGDAILTLDADGQHPVELIPEFISRWQAGSKVVIGIRTDNQKEGMIKRYGSKLFYGIFSSLTGMKLVPGLSDFRIIDRSVQQDFVRMTERNRITRGLIEWLGYSREYIEFKANPRLAGDAAYSFRKLFKLAIDSAVSLSISPLYITAYIGAVVLPLSVILGVSMLLNALIGDPFQLRVTGSAYVVALLLFLMGILLVSQGIIGLYLSHIHTEAQNRPLYIIDKDRSLHLS